MDNKWYYDNCHPHKPSVLCNPLTLIGEGLALQGQAIHELQNQAIHFGMGVVAGTVEAVASLALHCLHPHHLCAYPYHHHYEHPHHHYEHHHHEHPHHHPKEKCTCYPDCKKWHASTDIHFETRLGETKIVTFLVENNRSQEAEIAVSAGPLIDAHGKQVPGNWFTFEPNSFKLQSGEAKKVRATFSTQGATGNVDTTAVLDPGMAYCTDFTLNGCPGKPISVGIWVLPETATDYYALCDRCRRRKGHFVEFCHAPHCCGHGEHPCGHCGGHHCDYCGGHGYHCDYCGGHEHHCSHCGGHAHHCGYCGGHEYWLMNWPCKWMYFANS